MFARIEDLSLEGLKDASRRYMEMMRANSARGEEIFPSDWERIKVYLALKDETVDSLLKRMSLCRAIDYVDNGWEIFGVVQKSRLSDAERKILRENYNLCPCPFG